jgi:integrase/recombinase XerC
MAKKDDRIDRIYATKERIVQINPDNIELWNKYLNGKRKLSENTKKSYESDMMSFFVFLLLNYDNKFLFDFDTDDAVDMLDDYVAMCSSVFGNKDRRLARRISSISSMYIFYKKKRRIKENPVELLERPSAKKGVYEIKQTFLTKEQVEVIRTELDKLDNTQLNLFFNLGLYTMARVNALCNIKIENIDLEKKRITDVIEKEGYNVTLLFDNRCKELIEKWLQERKDKGIESEYLFVTYYGGKWDKVEKSTLQTSWIKKIGAFINEPELHCHDLRHSGSNLRYQAGMKLEEVSKALNHKGTQVTQDHYLQMNFDKLQEELEKYSI